MGKNSSKHLWETGNSVNITNRSSLAEREVIANTAEESLVLLGEGIHKRGQWEVATQAQYTFSTLTSPTEALAHSHMCKGWGRKGPRGAFHQLDLKKDGPSSRHLGAQGTLS